MAQQHLIIDTPYGEVMLKTAFDCDTNTSFVEVYAGDNFDDYLGEIPNFSIYDIAEDEDTKERFISAMEEENII